MTCRSLLWVALVSLLMSARCFATDYFFVFGGGYNRQANQASLEANVLFFHDVLDEQHHAPRVVSTFFSDGFDDAADLQVLRLGSKTRTPATDFLARIFSFRGTRQDVEYRNHQVPDIAGPLDPRNIEVSLKRQAAKMRTGDRLFVYVTSHGGSAKGKNRHNTTISCWNKKSISSRAFESWLRFVPADVPVIMIMAQCYCGGFAHSIFQEANAEQELAKHIRVGFFAQQHDLAAAGCRPDIENDEEYSSYFWGAVAGRSRNGRTISDADLNANGRVSFAEAHAYAVTASSTIDIPLRSTEALLRVYSRIGNYEHERGDDSPQTNSIDSSIALKDMSGRLREMADRGRPDQTKIVEALADQLDIALNDDVAVVFSQFAEQLSSDRSDRRSNSRRRRGRNSGRRELWSEIADKWPELRRDTWRDSELLRLDNQQQLYDELKQLPSAKRFQEVQQQRERASSEAEQSEIRRVKYQRLINTLESIVLAENLQRIAPSSVVQRYREMLAVEESYLQTSPKEVSQDRL